MEKSISHPALFGIRKNSKSMFFLIVFAFCLPGLLLAQNTNPPSAKVLQQRQVNSFNKTGTPANILSTLAVQQADASTNPLLQIIQSLVGPGVTVSNVQTTLPATSNIYGSFTGGINVIGMDAGLLITSGSVFNAIGPNISPSSSQDNAMPGYTQLDSNGFDAAVISFDVTSISTSLSFKYVFASEEYNEYVGSVFNDAFAFYISGPGIPTGTDIALIPGTNTPVRVNNVNMGLNSQYYINNDSAANADPVIFQNLEYDGLTKVFNTAAVSVVPGATYTITLVVQDVADHVYDSGVFLQGGSITSDTCLISLFAEKHNITCNGLNDGSIDLSVNGTFGAVQYLWSNGSTEEDLINLSAGSYTVLVTDSKGCSKTFAAPVVIVNPSVLTLGQPIITGTSCTSGNSGAVQLVANGGTLPYTFTMGGNTNSTGIFTGLDTGNYNYTVTDKNNCTTLSGAFNIPQGSNIGCSISVTSPVPAGFDSTTIYLGYGWTCINIKGSGTQGKGPYTYLWSTGATTRTISIAPLATTTYTITITNSNGCHSSCEITINVVNVRCGVGLHKVEVCHLNSLNVWETLCVNRNVVATHLSHGDFLGACGSFAKEFNPNELSAENVSGDNSIMMIVFPNPTSVHFTIQVGTDNTKDKIRLRILDMSGREIEVRENLTSDQIVELGLNYDNGFYIAELTQGNQKLTTKLVKLGK